MLTRVLLLVSFILTLSSCASLTRYLSDTATCIVDHATENWLKSRLNQPDWSVVSGGVSAGGLLGSVIGCGLRGIANLILGNASPSSTVVPINDFTIRRERARRCRAGTCVTVQDRAAAILEKTVPVPLTTECKPSNELTVSWLRALLPERPRLAEDIVRQPFGRELELSLRDVARGSDAAAGIARRAITRATQCAIP